MEKEEKLTDAEFVALCLAVKEAKGKYRQTVRMKPGALTWEEWQAKRKADKED